jgi:predicted RNA-binding protein YlxR (DUF448 family)
MCVGCRTRRPQSEMMRLTWCDGGVEVDANTRTQGRGCYLCRDAKCIERALKKRALARALRKPLEGGEAIADRLIEAAGLGPAARLNG